MQANRYATPGDFRRALEDRLKQTARSEGLPLQRLRLLVTFDRYLARLSRLNSSSWALKGGYAMELRIHRARTTRDIDLTLRNMSPGGRSSNVVAEVLNELQSAAALDLGDYFEFQVGTQIATISEAPYGGTRYPVMANLDERPFERFHVDVVIGDPPGDAGEVLIARDWLGFAGFPITSFPAISQEQQFAEKLHAYSRPRATPNSRAKDLVDLILLIERRSMIRERLDEAIRSTFSRRKTHKIPAVLDPPPEAWANPFANMAAECGLSYDLKRATLRVQQYLDPILADLSGA